MSLKSFSDNEDTDEAVGDVGGEDIIDFESSSSEARRNLKWSILSKVYHAQETLLFWPTICKPCSVVSCLHNDHECKAPTALQSMT